MSLVVDASVACKWLVAEEGSDRAAAILEEEENVIAPDVIVSEVANTFWRKLRLKEVTWEHAANAVEALPGFFDELVPSVVLSSRSLAVAAALGHPVYDCFYIALAEARDSPLVTADKKLQRAVRRSAWRSRVRAL